MKQTVLGFVPTTLRQMHRRKGTKFGPSEMPLLVDPEPYMNTISAIDDLIRALRPAMHIPLVGNAVQRVIENCKQLRDSISYYERAA